MRNAKELAHRLGVARKKIIKEARSSGDNFLFELCELLKQAKLYIENDTHCTFEPSYHRPTELCFMNGRRVRVVKKRMGDRIVSAWLEMSWMEDDELNEFVGGLRKGGKNFEGDPYIEGLSNAKQHQNG